MKEQFAKPCVGAIIERNVNGEKYILMQIRQKEDGGATNGLFELPAGKIREYENIFDALRREVWEETGLRLTKIYGEELAVFSEIGNNTILSFEPYCITQNLSGAYSIILHTFLCEAEGELLASSDETQDIHWEKVADICELVEKQPEKIFLMHVNALRKYVGKNCERQ